MTYIQRPHLRLLICGGRDFEDRLSAFKALDWLLSHYPVDCVIHGNARGVDRIGHLWAIKAGIDSEAFQAEWNKYGNGAGPIRNQRMLEIGRPNYVVAFPGGAGTADMVQRARSAGVTVWEPLRGDLP